MRKVSESEYNDALNNVDIIKILNKIGSQYNIPKDELSQIKNISIWNSLKSYNKNKNTKFTTYLVTIFKRECFSYINKEKKHKKVEGYENSNIEGGINKNSKKIYELLEILTEDQRKVLTQRFFHNKTLKEIGEENGYSYFKAKYIIDKAIKTIKNAIE